MILSSRQISHLIKNEGLVKPSVEQIETPKFRAAWERGINNVEGVNFELSIASVLRKDNDSPEGFIGIDSRQTPLYDEIGADNDGWWRLGYGFYEVKTFETINQPVFLASRLVAKRTPIVFGTTWVFADVAPGYSGTLGVGLFVFPGCVLPIERGALFMSISFATIDDVEGVTAWDGVWKNDRTHLDTTERPR